MSGLYSSGGLVNVTVVSSTTLSGIYARDGSLNVSLSDGTNRGLYAPGGSIRVTVATNTAAQGKVYAPDGSWYITATKGSPVGALAVLVISGSLGGGGGGTTGTPLGLLLALTHAS